MATLGEAMLQAVSRASEEEIVGKWCTALTQCIARVGSTEAGAEAPIGGPLSVVVVLWENGTGQPIGGDQLTICAQHLHTVVRNATKRSLQSALVCMLAYDAVLAQHLQLPKAYSVSAWDALAAVQKALLSWLSSLTTNFTETDIAVLCFPRLGDGWLRHIHSIKQWMRRVPYGKVGTAVYCMLLEVLFVVTDAKESAIHVLAGLLNQPRDERRAAEVLLYFVHPEFAQKAAPAPSSSANYAIRQEPRQMFTPELPTAEDAEVFLHRCASGVPAPFVWAILDRPALITRSIDDANAFNAVQGGRRETRAGVGRPGHSLIGKWYVMPLEVKGFSVISEGRCTTGVMYLGEEGETEELRVAGDAALPGCPLRDFTAQCGCVVGDKVLWFSELAETANGVYVEMVCGEDVALLLRLQTQQAEGRAPTMGERTPRLTRSFIKRDDLSNETAVAFCSRLLHTTLAEPPTPDLPAKLERILQSVRVLAKHFLVHIEQYDYRRFHPATLLIVFQAMIKNWPYFHEKVFGTNGWLINQAKARPSMKLISLLALAFQADIPIQPKDAVSVLHYVSLHETKLGGGNEPIAILQCLDAVTTNAYDGLWTWQRGRSHDIYEGCILIAGYHVLLFHPSFSHAEVLRTAYEGNSLSFTIGFRMPTYPGTPGATPNGAAANATPGHESIDTVRGGLTVVLRQRSPACSDRLDATWYSNNVEISGEFIKTGDADPMGWGIKAINSCHKLLRDIATGWDASALNPGRGSASVIQQILSDRQVADPLTPYEAFLLDLWSLASQRMLKSAKFKSLQQLDEWVLLNKCGQGAKKTILLNSLTGIRREAAKRLLSNYFQMRKVEWDIVPISIPTLQGLQQRFAESIPFLKRVENASCELQGRIKSNRISLTQLRNMEKHSRVLDENNVVLADTRPALEATFQDLENVIHMLKEVIHNWHVSDEQSLFPKLESTIRQRDLVPLDELRELCHECKILLKPALDLPGSVSSPIVKAFFITQNKGATVPLKGFAPAFHNACLGVGSLSLNTLFSDAVASLHPPDCDYSEGRLDEERRLLQALHCKEDVIHALLHGAIPLNFILHDLGAFRKLAFSPPEELTLHKTFFSEEDKVLLTLNDSSLTLGNAEAEVQKVLKCSSGCQHRVLQIIDTVLQCPSLVRFTRENPEAQDAGLSSVLSNSRDMQHACFQTFLNCCAYINPFVAASQKHVTMYNEQQEALAKGAETGVVLRPPICNSSGESIGFWESLNKAFGDTGFESIAAIREMLLKMSGQDNIGELEVMIKEQNGTTDKLIEECRMVAGLAEDIENAGPPPPPAQIVVHFPPTGQVSLECRYGNTTRNGSEYRDIIYRATLQKELSPTLSDFVSQAREVLRAFNAACKVFAEGHLEFRSRRLSFAHDDAQRIAKYLQAVQGQWASDSMLHNSVFLEACREFPELSCAAPAELVRMAELLRSVRSVGDVTIDEANLLCSSFRRPRGRSPTLITATQYESDVATLPTPRPTNLSIPHSVVGVVDTKYNLSSEVSLILEGTGPADGRYTEGLWCYKRTDSDAILCPSQGAWVVYENDKPNAKTLLSSVSLHDNVAPPWEMGDWRDPTGEDGAVLSVKVQKGDGHHRQLVWSTGGLQSEQTVSVIGARSLNGLKLQGREGSLWIDQVAVQEGMIWESIGLEQGMRILAVNNEHGTPEMLQDKLTHAATSQGNPFSITVTPSWVWQPSPNTTLTPSQRIVVKTPGPPSTILSLASGEIWRVRISGNIHGMKVGLCGPDFDPSEDVENSKHVWWYLRCGLLRHAGHDVGVAKPYRSGDIVTVTRQFGKAFFDLNGERLASGFEGLPGHALRPVVFLLQETASVELSPGAPVVDACKWSVLRHSPLIEVGEDVSIARRIVREGKSGVAAAAVGEAVLRGPGPHTFSFQLTGQSIQECLVGVAPPAVFLDRQYDSETALFGLTIRPDGNIFGLKENRILYTPKKKVQFSSHDVITFELDLGEGTIEILKNGDRILHSSSVEDLPSIQGPLVPYCVLPNVDVECRLLPTPKKKVLDTVPAVVIKGVPAQGGHQTEPTMSPAQNSALYGVYERCAPTYTRSDEAFHLFHWSGRWCIGDVVETPFAWSDTCDVSEHLGTVARQWSVVQGVSAAPSSVLLTVPEHSAIRLQRSPEDTLHASIIYQSVDKVYTLGFDVQINSWVVWKEKSAVFMSLEPAALPSHCKTWAWGDGVRWRMDDRIAVTSDDTPGAAHVALRASVRAVATVDSAPWHCVVCHSMNGAEERLCAQESCGAERERVEEDMLDSMTQQELAGWHIVKNAAGAASRAPQMRVALEESAEGSTSGVELVMSWDNAENAIIATREAAKAQLTCIGKLLRKLKTQFGRPDEVLEADNYDPTEPKYGLIQVKSIDANVVDTSRLTPSDRRVFALSLFKGNALPYHILDCDEHTPPEDVRAFIVMYKLMRKGRLVVFNVQVLGPDLQNEVRRAAEEVVQGKQLIALITEASTASESVDFVDNNACDVRWRRWAHDRVIALRKFDSVTYFDHPTGTGKSFAIEQMVRKGHWGALTPTRLDLDSTKTCTEDVCVRLMAPLRAEKGLLIVNVAYDSDPHIVNKVLDGLALLGRITSQSGLTVVTPSSGWHLVVEFQEPPGDVGKAFPAWRRNDGSSDITLLSCRGLAEQGQLLPYDIKAVERGAEALTFLTATLEYLFRDHDLALRMLAMGLSERPEDAEEEAVFTAMLMKVPARLLTRALRFAAGALPQNPTSSRNLAEKEMRMLEALSIAHEMRHFVNPSDPDHFHMKVFESGGHRRVVMTQLSGSTPPHIEAAVQEWKAAVEKFSSMSPPVLRFEAATPPHQLVDVLTDELHIQHIKTCASKLAEKNYVIIPDFLQKLLQVNSRIHLRDPAILQGPSGTGKSYAITMLADLLQLPSRTKQRRGFVDIEQQLMGFLRLNSDVRKMFPNNISDMVGGIERVIWNAENTDRVQVCLKALLEHKCLGSLQLIVSALMSSLGPQIVEATDTHERASSPSPTPTSPQRQAGAPMAQEREAREAILSGKIQTLVGDVHCKDVFTHIEAMRRWLRRIGGGILNLQVEQCIETVLQSNEMKALAGRAAFDFVRKSLESKPKVEAALAWAREAVGRAVTNGAALTQLIRSHMREQLQESPLLQPPPELLRILAEGDGPNGPSGDDLAHLISIYLSMERKSSSKCVLMRYYMTPSMLFEEMRPILDAALKSPDIQFIVLLDEMNATHMLGLVKRIVVDRWWDMWNAYCPGSAGYLPPNVAFIGAINPAKKEAALEGDVDSASGDADDILGFDVTPMPPSLMEHIISWRQLAEHQRAMFISRLVASNPIIFKHQIAQNKVDLLAYLLLLAHRAVQKFCLRKRSTVSQRDVHRAVKIFEFFFKRDQEFVHNLPTQSTDIWDLALSSMLLGVAVSYYFRLAHDDRKTLSTELTTAISQAAEKGELRGLPDGITFADVVQSAVCHFCGPHLSLPDAVYAHDGLRENLFVQMVCFDNRMAVILHGPPGTSKTLSNNIIRDNMTGRGEFWGSLCTISEMCRYQGSAQSSADEIKKKCEEAYQGQRNHDSHGQRHKRCLLFVDEAGLIKGEGVERKYALKVLHYYLEGCSIASVLMTNQALDPAIGNRCVEVYMAQPHTEELSRMCAGILHPQGVNGLTPLACKAVPACCNAFHSLLAEGGDLCWWYGLRDLFHLMRYIKRNQPDTALVSVTPEVITAALERNFNGQTEMFERVLESFGNALEVCGEEYSYEALKGRLRQKLDVVVDSILDNNRATAGASGKNLNDMWVRFKLLVDNTDDGSMLQLLKHSGIAQLKDVQVFSLSALSQGDELMPVTVVSQITAAMETGRTVWLTNTRAIDGCLFDVFNQSYVVASNGKGDVLHFVAVAIGAALEYKRVHRDFQCIVHVTKRELAGRDELLPAPYLNRLEKFTLSTHEVLEHALAKLSTEDCTRALALRARLEEFTTALSSRNRCVFSDVPAETLNSLLLEMMQTGSLQPFALSTRLAQDVALQHFLYDEDGGTSLWRSATMKLLHLLVPDAMLHAQDVLKQESPAYVRAYFRDLQPWGLSAYIRHVCDDTARSPNDTWDRTIVYSPANADFASLLADIPGCHTVSSTWLHESECGGEDFEEAVYKFCVDSTSHVFVVVVEPESLGMPECRELRNLLESPPEICTSRSGKAVVLLQLYHSSNLARGARCTPLYGTGWGEVYIDAGAEKISSDLLLYVTQSVIGRRPERAQPEWGDMDAVLHQAINALMQGQLEAQSRWVFVNDSDGAASLYQPKTAFGEQVATARLLLHRCPRVRRCLLTLHRCRLPTAQGLVAMAHEVAQQEGAAVSLAQRLIDEEHKSPCTLLAHALWFLLDDRTASAFLGDTDETKLALCDTLLSMVLSHAMQRTTFDQLRWTQINNLPPLFVGASPPALPGSRALMDILHIPPHAVDTVAEAAALKTRHAHTSIAEIVALVESDPNSVLHFFSDCVRRHVRHHDPAICSAVVKWVLAIARRLHHAVFNTNETVWTVHALCTIHAKEMKAYILAMMPLSITNALSLQEPDMVTQHDIDFITNELCPAILAAGVPTLIIDDPGRRRFVTCVSSLCHRTDMARIASSKTLPALLLAAKVLEQDITLTQPKEREGEEPHPPLPDTALSAVETFVAQSVCETFPVSLKHLEEVVEHVPQATSAVALTLMQLNANSLCIPGLVAYVLGLLRSEYVSRGTACRVLTGLAPPLEGVEKDWIGLANAVYSAAVRCGNDVREEERYCAGMHGVLGQDVYTAVFDLTLDQTMGLNAEFLMVTGPEGFADIRARQIVRISEASNRAVKLYHIVQLAAIEEAFVLSLACLFRRPADVYDIRWVPDGVVVGDARFEKISSVAKELMQPEGFVCPARGSEEDRELIRSPPDAHCEHSLLTFIRTLESGTGSAQGMGTKSMLEYLRDQVHDEEIGVLVKMCGAAMEHKCQSAEPLSTKPGDLPFVYQINDPMYDHFLSLRRHMQTDAQEADPAHITRLATFVTTTLFDAVQSVEKMRTLLFYCAFRCYFAVKEAHPSAKLIACNEAIGEKLGLCEKQRKLLHLGLDLSLLSQSALAGLSVSGSLSEGFENAWTQMVCTTACVVAALPDSLFGSLLLDLDAQRDKFLPGDKTGGPIAQGGNYKFDCVTQLDPAGNLDSYACKQPVLSTGACYLLWGIEFGLFTLQLALFPEALDTVWNWLFSKTIQTRDYGYQKGLGDHELMVMQLTERSMAYHLHMSGATGLSCDEASRVYSFFVYDLLVGDAEKNAEILRPHSTTREAAMNAERVVEQFWQEHTTSKRSLLARPQSDMCHTLKALCVWMEATKNTTLPRGDVALRQLDSLGGEGKPQLVDTAVHEVQKLALISPLLLGIVNFSLAVHDALSGRLRQCEGSPIAYRSLLELLSQHVAPGQVEVFEAQLATIKRLWNAFRHDVGPIDFECEEGGINIDMPEHTTIAGSPGLPDTLDFWINYNGTTDAAHKDLMKAAVLSLTDKVYSNSFFFIVLISRNGSPCIAKETR